MLKGIDPLLSGELLHVLDTMGHADQLALVDRNFPAASAGRPVIRLGEVGVVRALSAILTVFPLDSFVEKPLERMEVDDDASVVTENQRRVLDVASREHGTPLEYGVIKRLDFYERVRHVSVVIHTLEPQPWGCFILQKGVVFDD
jgi:L-fucose mutarotase